MTDKLLLTDEEFLEWCGSHRVIGCGGSRTMEGVDREVSMCEDCRAKAQLFKAKPLIEKQERERIAQMAKHFGGFGSLTFRINFEQALKGE